MSTGAAIDWQQVVKGSALLGAVIFDAFNKNKGRKPAADLTFVGASSLFIALFCHEPDLNVCLEPFQLCQRKPLMISRVFEMTRHHESSRRCPNGIIIACAAAFAIELPPVATALSTSTVSLTDVYAQADLRAERTCRLNIPGMHTVLLHSASPIS